MYQINLTITVQSHSNNNSFTYLQLLKTTIHCRQKTHLSKNRRRWTANKQIRKYILYKEEGGQGLIRYLTCPDLIQWWTASSTKMRCISRRNSSNKFTCYKREIRIKTSRMKREEILFQNRFWTTLDLVRNNYHRGRGFSMNFTLLKTI